MRARVCVCVCVCVCVEVICSPAPPLCSVTSERRKNEGIEAAVIAMRGSGNYLVGALSLCRQAG